MRCGDCKHWKPVPVYDDETDALVLEGLGWCMKLDGEAFSGGPDDGSISRTDIEIMGDRDAAACDGSGYRAALLTRDRFGCVLFEPKDVTS